MKRRHEDQAEPDEAQRLADRELLEAAMAPYDRDGDDTTTIDLRGSLRGAPVLRLRHPALQSR